ncbi:MAG: alginate lyase family protein [Balneolaceae bacterium]
MHSGITFGGKGLLFSLLLFFAAPAGFSSCMLLQEARPDLSNANTGPYLTSEQNLEAVKDLMEEGHPLYTSLLERLVTDADRHLDVSPWSVTHQTPPSPTENPHDYVSIARYVWQNTAGAFETRDGQANPEVRNYDRDPLSLMAKALENLSLAYYYTGEQKYGRKAGELLRTWFLDEETRMTPHFRHAQFVPGQNEGGPQGIIEARDFISVIEAASLVYDSDGWSPGEHRELKYWFYDFMRWVIRHYSTDAFLEYNVGTWIDAQKTIYALFTEQTHLLSAPKTILPVSKRLDTQISESGEQLRELSRSNAQDYTWFNLKAYIYQAEMRIHSGRLTDSQNISLYSSAAGDEHGGRLVTALDWLLPYATGEKTWQDDHSSLSDFNTCRYIELYRPAALALGDERYENVVRQLQENPRCRDIPTLLTHPPLDFR